MSRGGLPIYRRQAMYRAIEAENARAEMGRSSVAVTPCTTPAPEDHRDVTEIARAASAALKGAV